MTDTNTETIIATSSSNYLKEAGNERYNETLLKKSFLAMKERKSFMKKYRLFQLCEWISTFFFTGDILLAKPFQKLKEIFES